MIGLPWQADAWTQALKNAVSDLPTLRSMLDLEEDALDWDLQPDFALKVPRQYVARMQKGNPHDPLLLQVAPRLAEKADVPGYVADPLEETAATVAPGLVRKYAGRALVIAATSCAVNCRYCFRRNFPYADHRTPTRFQMLDQIAADPTIKEVILSGGDPLLMTDARLASLIERIDAIGHVQRLRVHTRVPVVIPERINEPLLDMLTRTRARTVMVFHFNHPNELDDDVRIALGALHERRITLLNQSVLLRGVNDLAPTLIELSEALFAANVMPYYLHLPDRVLGTAHFDVDADRAIEIYQRVRAALPGYLVPKLVREIPGELAKTLVGSDRDGNPNELSHTKSDARF